jgi:mannose-6-phosphate isomerase-like protein (cupin superfamily)
MEEAAINNQDFVDAASAQIRGDRAHLRVAEALQKLAAAGTRSVALFEHGSLQVKIYAPRGPNGELIDPQQPHTRDEIYVVAQGRGVFYDGVTRRPFQTGDLLFAPAGSTHRFEDFSADFAVWVMFYGPEGGEPRA